MKQPYPKRRSSDRSATSALPLSSRFNASATASRTAPSVEKPNSARFSQAASIVEISVSVMSRPLVLQYVRQKRRKIVRLIIDEIGMRIHIARLRPIIHPYRSEEHTSELQSLMRISYAVFCL